MTSYIPAFITRRFSRPGTDAEPPSRLVIGSDADSQTPFRHAALDGQEDGNREIQNAALDRVLAGDDEDADVLSPMSIGTPIEQELRRIDHDRLGQAGHPDVSADAARSRGSTDPLPRRGPIRTRGGLRRSSWQARLRNNSGTSLGEAIHNAANPRAGAAGYVDDPSRNRSVRASYSSTMSMGVPGTPEQERKDPALPADDGMKALRARIQAVQMLDVSADEKSRLMHIILNERYAANQGKSHREILRDVTAGRATSPAAASLRSVRSQDAPMTPRSEQSGVMDGLTGPNGEVQASPSTSVFTTSSEHELQVASEDLKPTYYSKEPVARSRAGTRASSRAQLEASMGDEDLIGPQVEDEKPLGCPHYMRNVKLQCHACLRWYTCRFCHDEVEDHSLVRRKTKNMLCMLCGTAQPAAPACASCGEDGASYYCDVCKLWDNDPQKSIYHCDDCGICRVGQGSGKDFFHCKVCDVCISMNIKDTHKCIERSVDCDCPICGEYMFTSPRTVVYMRCGHTIHRTCYEMHLQTSFKCPICSKSLMNMEMSFRSLDRAIAAQPMPEDFRDTKALVLCNDCRGKSSVPYHWLGLKCAECDSYNTAQLRLIGPNEQAEEEEQAGRELPGSGVGTPGLQSGVQTGSHTPRGRAESGLQVYNQSRRPTSTSAIQDPRTPLGSEYFLPIANGTRSVSAMGVDRPPREHRGTNATDSMDVDAEDDMDFWGRDLSPGRLTLLDRPRRVLLMLSDDGDEGEDSDSDDDDAMEGVDDLDDDEDDDDDGTVDQMDIFGHR